MQHASIQCAQRLSKQQTVNRCFFRYFWIIIYVPCKLLFLPWEIYNGVERCAAWKPFRYIRKSMISFCSWCCYHQWSNPHLTWIFRTIFKFSRFFGASFKAHERDFVKLQNRNSSSCGLIPSVFIQIRIRCVELGDFLVTRLGSLNCCKCGNKMLTNSDLCPNKLSLFKKSDLILSISAFSAINCL